MTGACDAEMKMHVRAALSMLAMLAASPHSAAAPTLAEAAQMLDGEWRGSSFVLRVDSERAQASIASDRPFEWQRFVVKEVGDNEVVFSVGAELFEATISADTLTLTGTSFRGARVLFRDTELRGTTEE